MVYHFVKHIGFDIKADSLEQAKEIAEYIDNDTDNIEDAAHDSMINAINDALDVGVLREDVYDNCDVHAGDSEYVGYTEDADDNDDFDAEKDFFNYLIDADDEDDEDDEDVCYILTDKGRDLLAHLKGENPDFDENDYDARGKRLTKTEDSEDAIADAIANAIISAFLSAMIG